MESHAAVKVMVSSYDKHTDMRARRKARTMGVSSHVILLSTFMSSKLKHWSRSHTGFQRHVFWSGYDENSTANNDTHCIIFLLQIEYTSRHVDHYRNLFTNILPVCTFNVQLL